MYKSSFNLYFMLADHHGILPHEQLLMINGIPYIYVVLYHVNCLDENMIG
jgi:hypothetical protein